MPVTTRSRFASAQANRRSSRSGANAVPEVENFHAFVKQAYTTYRSGETAHSFAMRNLSKGMAAAGADRFSSKVVYDALVEFVLRQTRRQAATTSQQTSRRRTRSAGALNQLLWAQWVNWFEAFYEEGREAGVAQPSAYAVQHWRNMVTRQYNLDEATVSEWLDRQDAERLLDSVGM